MERHSRSPSAAADGGRRFDGRSVRQILQLAAIEQQRLDRERTDTYSLQELEEMAAQARISPEALRDAVRRVQGRGPSRAGSGRWLPGRWPAIVKATLLGGAGVVALFALLLAFPVVAHVILWATLMLSLLLLLGASPF